MPPGKDRSKEDTWKESDLKKALKDDRKKLRDDRKSKEHSSHRDEDRRERKDREHETRRRDHDEVAIGERSHRRSDKERDREHRKRDEEKDRDRRREKEQERDKDRERERRREKDRERSKERDRSRETRNRDKSRERRKERESLDVERHRDQERRRQRDKERDAEKDGEKRSKERRGHEKDRESERRREHGKERDSSRDRRKDRQQGEREKRREVEKEDKEGVMDRTREREREKERERRKEREKERLEKESRDSGKEERRRQRERHDKENPNSDKDAKRREHHRSRTGDGSNDTQHSERRGDHRDRRKDNKDRRKERSEGVDSRENDAKEDRVRRREKEMMESLKREEEQEAKRKELLRFRSDTVEEADTVDEDVEQRRKASLQKVPSIGAAEEINEEEPAGYDYEEDFEDYDEDFEDDGDEDGEEDAAVDLEDHSGMQELLQAINAENQDARLSSREGSKEFIETHKGEKETTRSAPAIASRGRINFVAARQKQITDKVASRTRRRGQELMHLIDLDVAAFDIFDLPPLNEYELYIKNFGRSDTKQAYVQCNEDNVEREVQTEEIETRTKWTQNPASDPVGFGDEEHELQDDLSTLTEKANIDSLRLSKFLQRAAQTCLILLEENTTEQTNMQFKDKKDMSCSDGFLQLSPKHSYLQGRSIQSLHLSPVQTHLLLTAYGPVKEQGKAGSKTHVNVQDKAVVCLWNTNEPSEPSKVLVCESMPRCCCLSPSKATLAFAGLEDGSLVAWDLREASSMHRSSRISDGNSEVVLRLPTFSTAGVLKKDESHLSPVVSLLPVVMPGDSMRASGGMSLMSDDMLGLSFQLASLEENGTISIWVVVELEKTDTAGSESDLGLLPGGKIKLIKSSSISLQSPFRDFRKSVSLQALIMRLLPHDPNHIYVGTGGGYILHCLRHGGRAPPKTHRPEMESVVDIPALDVSPWQLPCILAGSRDGTLWLYNLKNETPLSTWSRSTGGSAVVSVQWSRSKPSVFYVLDASSCLHIWDLLKSDEGPIAVEKFKHGRVVCFELSSDYSASGIGIAGRSPELVLAYDSGAVEIHRLNSLFINASGDELDRFSSYLDGVL